MIQVWKMETFILMESDLMFYYGMNFLKYELVSIEEITPKAKMINVS